MNGTCGSNLEPSRFRSCPTRPTTPPERGRSLIASVLSIRSAMLRIHGTPQIPFSPATRPRFGVPLASLGIGSAGAGAPRCANSAGVRTIISTAIDRIRIAPS
ncbi:MAG: hypothetical protein DMG03_19830 [Acidobacteria bacterium]|nr:MAG: hypothetical protein DMG03_19830 [Acidobacteriota bacterium]